MRVIQIGFLSLFLVSAAAGTVLATDPDNSSRDQGTAHPWEEAAGFQFFVGDSVDVEARVFDSADFQQQLLIPGRGDNIFVLVLKTRSVRMMPRTALRWISDVLPTLDPSAAAVSIGFTSDGAVVSFENGSVIDRLQPEPPLVGPITWNQLFKEKPDYVYAASRFHPNADAVRALKSVTDDVHLVVFFGTWCTFCKHWLPQLMATLQTVSNPRITSEFYGMSEDQQEPKDAVRRYNVTGTPTIIVLRSGKEMGRIVENPQASIESDLVQYLGAR